MNDQGFRDEYLSDAILIYTDRIEVRIDRARSRERCDAKNTLRNCNVGKQSESNSARCSQLDHSVHVYPNNREYARAHSYTDRWFTGISLVPCRRPSTNDCEPSIIGSEKRNATHNNTDSDEISMTFLHFSTEYPDALHYVSMYGSFPAFRRRFTVNLAKQFRSCCKTDTSIDRITQFP